MSPLKRALRSGLERLNSELEVRRSRRIELSPQRPTTMCLALGPNRNLAALTTGPLSLHRRQSKGCCASSRCAEIGQ